MKGLDEVRWNEKGLVPAIAQDVTTGRVLMLAWMDASALEATITERRAVYWSRSRRRLWRKGEESGHVQMVKEIRLDCDGDTILLLVEQIGGIACHTGRESCFFKRSDGDGWNDVDPVLKDPDHIYAATEKTAEGP